MRYPLALVAALTALSALAAPPAAGQMKQDPKPRPSPTPTRAVTRSGRLVTARTSGGGTQSYNCNRPENAKRAVCKGVTDKPAATPK